MLSPGTAAESDIKSPLRHGHAAMLQSLEAPQVSMSQRMRMLCRLPRWDCRGFVSGPELEQLSVAEAASSWGNIAWYVFPPVG